MPFVLPHPVSKISLRGFVSVLIMGSPFCVGAPTDAGSILKQIERSLPPPQLPQVGPSPVESDVTMPPGVGERVVVKTFGFSGNTVVGDVELSEALRTYLNRPLTFEDLRNAAAQVALVYRERGYLAAASIPKQDVTEGVVRITVNEGWFGSVRMDGPSEGRLRPGLAEAYVQAACRSADPLNMYDLDRALLLINDLSGASVQGAIAKGKYPGQADVVLVAAPASAGSASLVLDNSGSRSTGAARAIGNLSWQSPLGLGDLHGVDFLKSEGSGYIKLSTQYPVGYNGLTISAHASRLDYQLVASDFSAAKVEGNSTTFSLEGDVPLLRTRSFNLYVSVGGDMRYFRNFGNGASTSDYRSTVATVAIRGNRFDRWLGGGTTAFSLQVARGTLDLGGSPNQAADFSGPRSDGDFTKLGAQCSRTQSLAESTSLLVSFECQLALDRNLDSSEKFFVGGAGSVRAYAPSEGGGDSGYMGTVEIRQQLADSLTATAFVDHGGVVVNKNSGFAGAASDNHLPYSGYGLGLVWTGPLNSRLSLSWSQRIGDNPNPKPGTGADQDGTHILNRFWGSLSFQF